MVRAGRRKRGEAGMTDEALCKVLCHNLVVLIQEMHELGITHMLSERSE